MPSSSGTLRFSCPNYSGVRPIISPAINTPRMRRSASCTCRPDPPRASSRAVLRTAVRGPPGHHRIVHRIHRTWTSPSRPPQERRGRCRSGSPCPPCCRPAAWRSQPVNALFCKSADCRAARRGRPATPAAQIESALRPLPPSPGAYRQPSCQTYR